MTVKTITPHAAANLLKGDAKLIDIRGPDEHARERIDTAECMPLDLLAPIEGDTPLIPLPLGPADEPQRRAAGRGQ